MPLTEKGKAILRDFKRQYGDAQGKKYFYAYMQENPKITREWHLNYDKSVQNRLSKIINK